MRTIQPTDRLTLRALILSAIFAGALASVPVSGGASIAAAAEIEVPPLCDAAYRGDLQKVRLLLRKGAAPDAHVKGSTALMQSLQPFVGPPSLTMGKVAEKERGASAQRNARKLQIATLLISAGADVKRTDETGATALHSAALALGDERTLVDVIRDLLRRGAIVDAETTNRVTPLQLAVWKRRVEVAKVLVAAGASLDARDTQGKSAADELIAQHSEPVLRDLRKVAAAPR
jgi:ankyrin repeat protein